MSVVISSGILHNVSVDGEMIPTEEPRLHWRVYIYIYICYSFFISMILDFISIDKFLKIITEFKYKSNE